MTDRGESALRQTDDALTVGPSEMRWDNGRLIVKIRERTVPHFDVLEGEVILTPTALTEAEVVLHNAERHIWRPFAPTAAIDVRLNRPSWSWSGHGYFDANFGTAALEDDFSYWTWGRFPTKDGSVCFYDATRRDGSEDLAVALAFNADGSISKITAPPLTSMRRSLWAVRRETRADAGFQPRQTKMMLDAPFYCRAGVQTKINGQVVQGVHEALDLNRFASPLLKPILAVKVPRRAGWNFERR